METATSAEICFYYDSSYSRSHQKNFFSLNDKTELLSSISPFYQSISHVNFSIRCWHMWYSSYKCLLKYSSWTVLCHSYLNIFNTDRYSLLEIYLDFNVYIVNTKCIYICIYLCAQSTLSRIKQTNVNKHEWTTCFSKREQYCYKHVKVSYSFVFIRACLCDPNLLLATSWPFFIFV